MSVFNTPPNTMGGGVYNEALGYTGTFRQVIVAGNDPSAAGHSGQWQETARVNSPTPRSWLITRAPMVGRSTASGQRFDPVYLPQWGTEVMGDVIGSRGRVTWGDGQVEFVTEFDWKRGGTFVVHGSFVKVEAFAQLTPAGVGPADRIVQTGAVITPTHAGATGELTLSVHTGSLAETDFAVLTIPAFAKAVRWYQTQNNAAAPGHVPISLSAADDFTFAAGVRGATNTDNFESDLPIGSLAAGTSYASAAAVGGWWPLPLTAKFFGLQNDAGFAATIGCWVEFLLDVG